MTLKRTTTIRYEKYFNRKIELKAKIENFFSKKQAFHRCPLEYISVILAHILICYYWNYSWTQTTRFSLFFQPNNSSFFGLYFLNLSRNKDKTYNKELESQNRVYRLPSSLSDCSLTLKIAHFQDFLIQTLAIFELSVDS